VDREEETNFCLIFNIDMNCLFGTNRHSTINGANIHAGHVTNFFATFRTVADARIALLSQMDHVSLIQMVSYCRKTLPTLKASGRIFTQSKSCL